MSAKQERLIVVSNRLPFIVKRNGSTWHTEAAAGGLTSALKPVLLQRGGTWIGWPGTSDVSPELDLALEEACTNDGYQVEPVQLDKDEIHNFYHGFSNEVVWPLFHDLQSLCNFDPVYWRSYCAVNQKFARAVAATAQADDFVWVHDYHLMNVAQDLRALNFSSRLGFFLHIPFPSFDLFSKLPWCNQIIEALLQFDLLGFQTVRDRRNFVHCARVMVRDLQVEGRGQSTTLRTATRQVRVGAFPISIDFGALARDAAAPEVEHKVQALRAAMPACKLMLGIDRLDYTKGIPHRLRAFHELLKQSPHLRERISLLQVVVPSRVTIPQYEELKTTIEQLVGRINGEFMRPGGWVPVWYVYESQTPTDLLAFYRAADIGLVTPLKDGMNLVAKEYCATRIDDDGALILSEFAGAAAELDAGALLVNPYDVEGVAAAIRSAFEMSADERRARMRGLRQSIRLHDVFAWVNSFLRAARNSGPQGRSQAPGRSPSAPSRAHARDALGAQAMPIGAAELFFPEDALAQKAL